jgi:hypothetical protein
LSPLRGPASSYWCAGGAILGRQGPISEARALELLDFFAGETLAGLRRGDDAVALFCVFAALDLASAVRQARRWRRAAVG